MRVILLIVALAFVFPAVSLPAWATDVYLWPGCAQVFNYSARTWCTAIGPDSGMYSGYADLGFVGNGLFSSNTNALWGQFSDKRVRLYTGGLAQVDQSYVGFDPDWPLLAEYIEHISFDWSSVFTPSPSSPLLRLSVRRMVNFGGDPRQGEIIWSMVPGSGDHQGHVDMDIPRMWNVTFVLDVVEPVSEPSCIVVLLAGGLGLGGSALRKPRR